jgi:hypothetical protein
METNSKKLMEAMPSFDDFMNVANEIKTLSVTKMRLENQIKSAEAETFRTVMNEPKYFTNGKPVAVSYFENAYKFCGIDNGLVELRNSLAETQAALELKRNQFEVYRAMHDLFKTLVYQERVLT